MSLASPVKQDRIERHLSRQRGAGVRTVASSFGFTFGATTIQPDTFSEATEPSAKRRKLEEPGVRRVKQRQTAHSHNCDPATRHEQRPKARRRFENIEEEPVSEPKTSAEDDSILAIKKTSRRRSTSKAPKTKAAPTALPPAAAHDEATGRRPRRQAATAALDKVSQGFVQEAQNIDKMRRGQDVEPPKRRATKKAAKAIEMLNDTLENDSIGVALHKSTKDKIPETELDEPATEPVEEPAKKTTKQRRTRRKEVAKTSAGSKTSLLQNGTSTATRLPLAETTTNSILRSSSPEKPLKFADGHQPEIPQISPTRARSPVKSSTNAKNTTKGKRKPSKFVFGKDDHADEVQSEVVGTASQSHDVPDVRPSPELKINNQAKPGRGELHETCDSAEAGLTERGRGRPCKDVATEPERPVAATAAAHKKAITNEVNAKGQQPKRKRQCSKPVAEDASIARPEPGHKPSDDEDVDWLLQHSKNGKRPPLKQARSAEQRRAKDPAKLPDIDLDDLLSNIATFVPPSMKPSKRIG